MTQELDRAERPVDPLMASMWELIAHVDGGHWRTQSEDWKAAAKAVRAAYHERFGGLPVDEQSWPEPPGVAELDAAVARFVMWLLDYVTTHGQMPGPPAYGTWLAGHHEGEVDAGGDLRGRWRTQDLYLAEDMRNDELADELQAAIESGAELQGGGRLPTAAAAALSDAVTELHRGLTRAMHPDDYRWMASALSRLRLVFVPPEE